VYIAVAIIAFCFIAILGVRHYFVAKRIASKLLELTNHRDSILLAVETFEALVEGRTYANNRSYVAWRENVELLVQKIDLDIKLIRGNDKLSVSVRKLVEYWQGGVDIVSKYNEVFVDTQAKTMVPTLDGLGVPHNLDQRRAAACDEDNSLIVAGAGTGKTTTIQAKLAHLIHHLGVDPDNILLMSFTRAAAGEIADRVGRISPKLTVNTFHAFGLSVIKEVEANSPRVLFEQEVDLQRFINERFEVLLVDPAYCKKAMDWFAYYLYPVTLLPGFDSMDDYYQSWQTNERYLTILKERVRSQQEAMIANFLFLHGVAYEYERPYEHDTGSATFRQYLPDFYLPEYGLYLEHFGVDREGRVWFAKDATGNAAASRDYREQMEWKRGLHRQHGTKLVETFSYEFSERTWRDALTEKLRKHGVRLELIGDDQTLEILKMPEYVKGITQLVQTFLNLLKSSGSAVEALRARVTPRMPREAAFLDLFAPIFAAYENCLKENNGIDFHDMLARATDHIRSGRYARRFTHVIVDEFQDISVGKYRLIAALREANPGLKTFCVGDDWQSIYRFAGSDVALMADFERYFGFTRRMKLEESKRFCEGIAQATNHFVMRNPSQIRKTVRSAYDTGEEAVQAVVRKGASEDAVGEVLRALGAAANSQTVASGRKVTFSVFVLGRFGMGIHAKAINATLLRGWNAAHPNLDITFHTAHSSKGLTSDFVVVIDVVTGRYGFPCGISDDSVLNLVMSRTEDFPYAEERRLMYVAMTRARHKVYLVTDQGRESIFLRELIGTTSDSRALCPECGGRMVMRSGPHNKFAGCSNFSKGCRGTRALKTLSKQQFQSLFSDGNVGDILVPENLKLTTENFR
jgi:DNA helicase-4